MARVSQAQLKHHDPTKTRRPAVRLPARVRPPACLPWVAQSWLPDGPERIIDSCAACSISTLEPVNHGFQSHLQRESQDECGDALGALDALDEFLVEAEPGALKRTTATARRPSARAMSGPRRPLGRWSGLPGTPVAPMATLCEGPLECSGDWRQPASRKARLGTRSQWASPTE
jgi:hypothetical protein